MTHVKVGRTSRKNLAMADGNRFCKCLLLALVATALLLASFSSDAEAAKRRHRSSSNSRRAAAAAKARKERAIKDIQRQIAVARQVLGAAESRVAMSQAEVNQAQSKLSGIREDIETAHDDVEQAAKALREIEAEILAEQPPSSDLARAQSALEYAKVASHDAIHRVLRLPDDRKKNVDAARLMDLARISDTQRKALDGDESFQTAQREITAAARQVDQLRETLFQNDADWVATQQELSEARQRSHQGTHRGHNAGASSLGNKQNLRKSQGVAADARAIISQGEARLRQLGAKSAASSGSSRASK